MSRATVSTLTADEHEFVRYVAEYDPDNKLRKELGRLYEDLVLNREERWSFGSKYTAKQWFEIYMRNQMQYDRAVEEYLHETLVQSETVPNPLGGSPPLPAPRSDSVLPIPPPMSTPRTKLEQVTGTPSGQRRAFTEEEEWRLAQYLAIENPAPVGRRGFQVYARLIANEGGRWSWGRNHTVQSWCERYRKNSPRFDKWIANYQRRFGIDPKGIPHSELWDTLPPLQLSHLNTTPGTSSTRGPSRIRKRSVRLNSPSLGQRGARTAVLVASDSSELEGDVDDEQTLPSLTFSAKALGKRPAPNRPREDGEEDSPPPLQRSSRPNRAPYKFDALGYALLDEDGLLMPDETLKGITGREDATTAPGREQRMPLTRAPQSQDSSPRLSTTPPPPMRPAPTSINDALAARQGPTPPTSESTRSPSPKKRPQAAQSKAEGAAEGTSLPQSIKHPARKRRREDDNDFFEDLEESAHSSPWPTKKQRPAVRLEGGFGNSVFTCPTRVAQAFTNGRRTSGVGALSPPKPVPRSPSPQVEWPPKRRKSRHSAAPHRPMSKRTKAEEVPEREHHPFSQPTQPKRATRSSTGSRLGVHHLFIQSIQRNANDTDDSSDILDEPDLNEDHHPFSQPSQVVLQEDSAEISDSRGRPEEEPGVGDLTDEEAVEAAILPPELTQKMETAPRKSDFGVQASPSKKASAKPTTSTLRIQRLKGKEPAQVFPVPDRTARRHTLALPSSTPFTSRVSPSRILGIRPRYSLPAAGPSRVPVAGYAAGTLSGASVSYAGIPITPKDRDELIQQGLETRLRGLAAETGFPLDIVNHAWRTTGQLALTRAFLLALCDHVTDTAGSLTRAFVQAAEAEGFYGDEGGPGSISMSEERQYYPPEDSKAANWLRENLAKMDGADARVRGGESEEDLDDSFGGVQTSRLLDRLRRQS